MAESAAMEVDLSDQTDQTASRAPQACVQCRKQKRKCSKELPACSLCTRMSRSCDYSESPAHPPGAEDFAMMRQKIADLEARLEGRRSDGGWHEPLRSISKNSSPGSDLSSSSSTGESHAPFPAAFFLDAEFFADSGMSIHRPSFAVPSEVLSTVGASILDIQDVVERYFANIHTWLPFVSKKRLQLALSNPSIELTPDFALLLLAMKLIIQVPPPLGAAQSVRSSPLYTLTKRYYSIVEASGLLTLQTLQALLLIAAYEIGHAIYPAAYLTTGNCARLGHALGIHDRRNAPQMQKKKVSWAELEELKRTWWTTMLLDRYVNLGSPGHPLATDDPARNDTLPADDTLWDEGEITTSEPLYVSSPTNVKAGAFARTCQATHLLGRLVRLLSDQLLEAPLRFTEAIQLHRTLQALANLLPQDVQASPLQYATPLAMCYSALLHLCDPFACTESNRGDHTVEETEMQTIAIAGIKTISYDILRFSELVDASIRSNPAAVSPLVGDCLYFSAATFAWLAHESGLREVGEAYHSIRRVLERIATRWVVGSQYLTILNKTKAAFYAETPFL